MKTATGIPGGDKALAADHGFGSAPFAPLPVSPAAFASPTVVSAGFTSVAASSAGVFASALATFDIGFFDLAEELAVRRREAFGFPP
jgi:hypothetical protein